MLSSLYSFGQSMALTEEALVFPRFSMRFHPHFRNTIITHASDEILWNTKGALLCRKYCNNQRKNMYALLSSRVRTCSSDKRVQWINYNGRDTRLFEVHRLVFPSFFFFAAEHFFKWRAITRACGQKFLTPTRSWYET